MAGSAKALSQGSAAPGPVPEGVIRLYSMRFCPFAQRTRLVLEAKGIKYETININLKNKPDWFLKKNPFGLIPVIEMPSDKIIYESPITCDYLDEVYPEKRLTPADPYEKAKEKMMLEHFSKVTALLYKIGIAVRAGESTSSLEGELLEKLGMFEEILASKKSLFFGGNSASMIDYMVWPWFERFEVFSVTHLLDHTPNLKRWKDAMMKDAAVKATITDPETCKTFAKLYYAGNPDACDYGL
ncbi:glutathione S-transferase omega-1 [Protopterus annectens]|uniref:glutathione S-transferase omega-1 n=1 Tax=Protopterus annectens TaxID=7888 RepID=UPI001CFA137E|nr:glutathione S-transferase omega-1 [Protopterus annectens]